MITLEPIAGLGNRLRAVDSACALADELGRPLRIIWTRTTDCACRFDRLFEPIPGAIVVERGWWANRLLRRAELLGGRYTHVIREPEMWPLRASGYDFRGLAGERAVFIQTCQRFLAAPTMGLASRFTLVAALKAECQRVTAGFTEATVGVHIRRGDHQEARQHSPTALFLERMSAEVRRRSAVRFFLATDDPGVEAEVRHLFGERVLTYRKPFNRDTDAGIRAAAVEMFALARTTRILGSYFSSFSEVAAELGGCPLDIVADR